jgi:hypothetical protein
MKQPEVFVFIYFNVFIDYIKKKKNEGRVGRSLIREKKNKYTYEFHR